MVQFTIIDVELETGSGGRGRVEIPIKAFPTRAAAEAAQAARLKEFGSQRPITFIRQSEEVIKTRVTQSREDLKESLRRSEAKARSPERRREIEERQARNVARARELALKNKAKRRKLTQKEFVELRTLRQLREGTTLTQQAGSKQKIITRAAEKERFTSIFTGGLPLTILGQPGRLAVQRATTVFPTGFIPARPVSPQETIQLAPPQILFPTKERTRFDIGGLIEAAPTRAEILQETRGSLIFSAEQQLLFREERKKISKKEKLAFGLGAGGLAAFEAELTLTGIPKAAAAIPEALAFGALAFVSPPAAIAVGTVALGVSIPGLQEEISEKGFLRTTASEAPTFAVFAAAGAFGARLRTTGRVKAVEFDIKLERLSAKDIDPSFTFEAKPFAVVSEGKSPAFLQRTISGDVLTPKQLDFLLREVRQRQEVSEPTTIKELRQELGRREKAPITREQAAKLDIFRPEVEEFLFVEPGRTGLVTPGRLGVKARQLQLRESFPTVAQKGQFLLAQLPRISKPSTQLSLLPRGRKGQAGLLQQQFDIGDIFRGAGEGLRRVDRLGPELPRIREPIAARSRLGFLPSISTDIFGDVGFDQKLSSRTQQALGLGFGQIQLPRQKQRPLVDVDILQDQRLIQKQKSLVDVDILQDQKLELVTLQDILGEPITKQRFKERPTLFIPFEEPPPKKPPGRRALFGFDGFPGITSTGQGFDVLVREKGQNIKANTRSLPRTKALNLGAGIVDNSSAASFRIRKSKEPTEMFDDGFFFLGNKFRSPKTKSKLPPKQFIEKTDFRIDSAGEIAGITAKGLIARRKKTIRNEFLDFGFAGGMKL